MRVSKEKAAENRERILTEAARLFRERGLTGTGVDALTQAAGMTHGSLYSQFGSKECLIAEAMTHGFARGEARIENMKGLREALAHYLSPEHRDNPGSGCFMAALGGDMPRQPTAVRAAFTDIVKRAAVRIGSHLSKRSKRQREDDGYATIATMVGAMVLARGVDDAQLSARVLSASRSRLMENA